MLPSQTLNYIHDMGQNQLDKIAFSFFSLLLMSPRVLFFCLVTATLKLRNVCLSLR